MKILIISQYFWPESFRINDLALGLKDKGHKVTVLTGQPNYPGGRFFDGYGFFKKKYENYYGVDVVRVPLLPRGEGGSVKLALNFLSFALFASVFAPFRCRGNYDVIFVYEPSPITVGLPALLLKKLKNAPILFWVQDLWPETLSATGAIKSTFILKLVDKLVRRIYRGCDNILVQSKSFYSPIEKLGVEQSRILYFPNSAEELYHPMKLAAGSPEIAYMPEGFRVMFAGNIGVAQDFGTILNAAKIIKPYSNIHWLIIGDGRMLPWVKNQIKLLGLDNTVHLLGRHPVESMPRFFSLADAMLVSLKKEPIFSMTIPAKVQSYLACAKPLIAALDGEGARVIQEASAGLTTSAENPVELADAVLKLYRMSEVERHAMGVKGRQYFESNFERNMLLERLDGWFNDIKTITP